MSFKNQTKQSCVMWEYVAFLVSNAQDKEQSMVEWDWRGRKMLEWGQLFSPHSVDYEVMGTLLGR